LSLGGNEQSQTIKLAVQQAYQSGVLVVSASGNDGTGVPLYPAAFSEVVAVAATDKYGSHASFSNYGSHIEVSAPGQSIYSTLPGNRYEAWNGTSMACPHVAGLAGLILSRNSQLSNQQVRQLLISTVQDLGTAGRDTYYGYGRINAYSALSQTPSSGSDTTVPGYTPEPTYSTPDYGYGYYDPLCGAGYGYMAGVALIGLGLAHFSHYRRRKREK
jgi:subtilisin family serine protease